MIFWKLLLAHAIADFLLQPRSIVRGKRRLPLLLAHMGVHLAVTLLILYGPPGRPDPSAVWVVLGLVLLHGALDRVKVHVETTFLRQGRERDRAWKLFAADQTLHLLTIAGAWLLLEQGSSQRAYRAIGDSLQNPGLYLHVSFVILVVFGGGYFTGLVCRGFADALKNKEEFGMPRAGAYIGVLERSLALAAILTGHYEFVGFLLAAKSIARFPEMKDATHFAEYFIVGTLTSLSVAIFGGLLLLALT